MKSSEQLVVRFANLFGGGSIVRGQSQRRMTVLMYHKVLPDELAEQYSLRNLVVRESLFARQMAWLSEHCKVLTLGDAINHDPSEVADKPLVCVTFDDGYWDNYAVAAPAMEKVGLRGTFFLSTELVEGRQLWFDVVQRAWGKLGSKRIADLLGEYREGSGSEVFRSLQDCLGWMKGLQNSVRVRATQRLARETGQLADSPVFDGMSSQQAKELSDRGHEIGSHTVTHPILTALTREELESEVVGSKKLVQTWIGKSVPGFCYPNGNVNDLVREVTASAGYQYACTTVRGNNQSEDNSFLLRRRMISENSCLNSAGVFSAELFGSEVWGLNDMLRNFGKRLRNMRFRSAS